MVILAIETSCDDTCVALVKVKGERLKVKGFEILSNVVSSQVQIHRKYGGVYPFLAKREHQKNLPIVLKKVLSRAKNPRPDLIAVTIGPGLEPCLWVGVNFAKDLAKTRAQNYFVLGRAHKVCAPKLKVPIVPVNHIEAHIFANTINNQQLTINLFPAVCLVVSGGHTQLILMKNLGNYKILGETRDDAAGECFDKIARILGLGYPGGPAIAKEAVKLKKTTFNRDVIPFKWDVIPLRLPRPMIYQKNYDFSFSGLKTAVLYRVKGERFKMKDKRYVQEMCYEVQQAIIDVLIYKTLKAAKNFKAKSIILGGGVAANEELRKQFREICLKWKFKHLVPPKNFCTDNAAMVAVTAYFQWLRNEVKGWKEIEANANLRIDE